MLWLTILAAFVVAALAIVYVAWPLLRPIRLVLSDDDSPLAELLQRKDTLLLSIKELEFDYHTGKLSQEDYQRLDQRLRQQAIALLRQIEQAAPHTTQLDEELEAAIQRQRRVTDRVVNVAEKSQLHCPQCRAAVGRADKFCPQCGQKLVPADTASALSFS